MGIWEPREGKGFSMGQIARLGQKPDTGKGLLAPSLGLVPQDQVSFPCWAFTFSEAEWKVGWYVLKCTSQPTKPMTVQLHGSA